MVYELGPETSLSNSLGQALGGGLQRGFSRGNEIGFRRGQLQNALSNIPAFQQGGSLANLAGLAGIEGGEPFMNALAQYQQQQQQQAKIQQENQAIKQLTGQDISGVQDPKIRQQIVKNAENKIQESQLKNTAQQSFNTMASLLKRGNLGFGSGVKGVALGGQTSEDIGEFTSASGAIEALLVDMVSRGTLSNSRFKYITETLIPKPTDRDREIKGKLKGLAKVLGLDSSELLGGPQFAKKSGIREMRDPQGNVYDIPEEYYQQAREKGLQ